MKTRTINPVARGMAVLASGALMAGGFGFLFLDRAPVRGVTDLYWGLHLDGIMSLDDLFGLGHIAVYAALTVILGRFTRTLDGWLKIVGSLAALGLAVEIAQGLGGVRSFGIEDMLANFLGICVGFFVLVAMGPPRRRRRGMP
jgi:hypothetical protein